jgi:hypothetical protein
MYTWMKLAAGKHGIYERPDEKRCFPPGFLIHHGGIQTEVETSGV